MSNRAEVASAAAAGLRAFESHLDRSPCLVGFDGFVDSIINVVETRQSPEEYDAVPTIQRFGEKVLAAAGQSSNYEFVVKLRKLGGNGPIMANALATAGLPVTYIGCLGHPALDPVFEDFAKHAEVHSICEPGATDAVEFEDGKLMLGKHGTLKEVNQATIDDVLGRPNFEHIVARSKLIGMVNWTMLPDMETIWNALIDEVLPAVESHAESIDGFIFIDLADPEKRSREDLLRAMNLCGKMNRKCKVVLGLNLKEAVQVAEVLKITIDGDPEEQIEPLAKAIRAKLDLHAAVVHPRKAAAGALKNDKGEIESATFAGPFVAKPKLSTGAGDNFNAGFCLGLLAGLPIAQALCCGKATSGYYVRNAGSPTLAQLADFCDNLPDPQ